MVSLLGICLASMLVLHVARVAAGTCRAGILVDQYPKSLWVTVDSLTDNGDMEIPFESSWEECSWAAPYRMDSATGTQLIIRPMLDPRERSSKNKPQVYIGLQYGNLTWDSSNRHADEYEPPNCRRGKPSERRPTRPPSFGEP